MVWLFRVEIPRCKHKRSTRPSTVSGEGDHHAGTIWNPFRNLSQFPLNGFFGGLLVQQDHWFTMATTSFLEYLGERQSVVNVPI